MSTLATGGQNLLDLKNLDGYAASSLEYLWFHSSDANSKSVCGAFFIGLSILSNFPDLISSISDLIYIKVSQNLSSSFKLSLSVGSIIMVPGTGQDIVGAWKPKSINLLEISSSVIPVSFLIFLISIIHSWATLPLIPLYNTGKWSLSLLAI